MCTYVYITVSRTPPTPLQKKVWEPISHPIQPVAFSSLLLRLNYVITGRHGTNSHEHFCRRHNRFWVLGSSK